MPRHLVQAWLFVIRWVHTAHTDWMALLLLFLVGASLLSFLLRLIGYGMLSCLLWRHVAVRRRRLLQARYLLLIVLAVIAAVIAARWNIRLIFEGEAGALIGLWFGFTFFSVDLEETDVSDEVVDSLPKPSS